MLIYLFLLFLLPLINIEYMFLPLSISSYMLEKKKLSFSYHELVMYLLFSSFMYMASSKPLIYFLFYLSYTLTLFFLIKLIVKEDRRKKRKEMEMLFGKKKAEELMLIEEFLEYAGKKAKNIFILSSLRNRRDYFSSLIKFFLIVDEKAKRKALTKVLREA